MLVLTRKLHESITLTLPSGEVIEVEVVKLASGKVRLGVKAEPETKVMRKELVAA
jgi:carbon storage regulator CsrA